MSNLTPRPGNACLVCGQPDKEKPMCFRGEDWCCDLHRKVITNEMTPSDRPDLHESMRMGIGIRFMGTGPVAYGREGDDGAQ